MDVVGLERGHSLTIKGQTTVTGVKQVIAMEEREVRLSLGERQLLLTGKGFSAERLSLEEGVLVISGDVESVKYSGKAEVKGILKRLFK